MSLELPPQALRRTMIKSTVGKVKRSSYDLPVSKNPGHVFGLEVHHDPENAGAVISKWVQASPSLAARSGRSYIETNKQAIATGCTSAGELRRFANEHPEYIVKTPVKRKQRHTPSKDMVFGIKSKASEDVIGLIQARHTNFSAEDADYPDLTHMTNKGKLPLPRETKTSMLKDVRLNPKPQQKEPSELFKMSKFKNIGSTLSTQPHASQTDHCGEEYDDMEQNDF